MIVLVEADASKLKQPSLTVYVNVPKRKKRMGKKMRG